ncbi:MAG: HNH endonuclease, partial [Thermodesulfobacteriota bacterium]|nr:HNH endonuclease [Thermodesulfobacteriota bacterium]
MNQWNIPEWMEKEIIKRDKVCVYCGVQFTSPKECKKISPSWEHIVNDARIVTLENISRCCFSCNASKGSKDLSEWLESSYCKKKGISAETVADIVKKALENPPKLEDVSA